MYWRLVLQPLSAAIDWLVISLAKSDDEMWWSMITVLKEIVQNIKCDDQMWWSMITVLKEIVQNSSIQHWLATMLTSYSSKIACFGARQCRFYHLSLGRKSFNREFISGPALFLVYSSVYAVPFGVHAQSNIEKVNFGQN